MKDTIQKVCTLLSSKKLQEQQSLLVDSLSKESKAFSFANQLEEQKELF